MAKDEEQSHRLWMEMVKKKLLERKSFSATDELIFNLMEENEMLWGIIQRFRAEEWMKGKFEDGCG